MNPAPDNLLFQLTAIFAAYLIGSISAAIITCKLLGLQDPRTIGSHNPGATNVLRSGGKKAGAITLIGDMLKGLLPVLIAKQLAFSNPVIAAVAVAAFIGHIFPLYYGFKGGKGVATFYGVLVGVNWMSGLIALAIWGVSAMLFKISSLSALISVACAPLVTWQLAHSPVITSSVLLMALLIYWRHRSNIRHLLDGTEEKIGHKKEP